MPLDRNAQRVPPHLPVPVVVRARPLDRPTPVWCEAHLDDCALVQHYVLTIQVDGEETPVTSVTVEGHMP